MFYKFREFYIPQRMAGAIERYINKGILPGPFLTAVLENNLKEAVGQADDENLNNLSAYCGYLYNEAPANCYGSPKLVQKWVKMGGHEGWNKGHD